MAIEERDVPQRAFKPELIYYLKDIVGASHVLSRAPTRATREHYDAEPSIRHAKGFNH